MVIILCNSNACFLSCTSIVPSPSLWIRGLAEKLRVRAKLISAWCCGGCDEVGGGSSGGTCDGDGVGTDDGGGMGGGTSGCEYCGDTTCGLEFGSRTGISVGIRLGVDVGRIGHNSV